MDEERIITSSMKEEDFPDLASFQDCEREIVDKWDDIEGT